jgi:hypothetical protein
MTINAGERAAECGARIVYAIVSRTLARPARDDAARAQHVYAGLLPVQHESATNRV